MNKKNLYPENKEEANFVKETVEKFETKSNLLETEIEEMPEWQKEKILKGIQNIKEGKFLSDEEVDKLALKCLE